VFLLGELENEFSSLSPRAVRERLDHAMKRGAVVRLRRDLYASVPADVDPATFEPDRFHVVAAAKSDAVFCGHSALELLGVAYSVWNECTAYTTRRREKLKLGPTQTYTLLSHPEPLRKRQLEQLGVRSFDRAGVLVHGLGPERALVEGFRSAGSFGGLGEFVSSVSSLTLLDWPLLTEVLEAFGEKKLFAAVGWFLQRHQTSLNVPSTLLDQYRKAEPRVPVYLERSMGSVMKAEGWNLLVPERLTRMEESDAAEF
jgi:hypothetical protein